MNYKDLEWEMKLSISIMLVVVFMIGWFGGKSYESSEADYYHSKYLECFESLSNYKLSGLPKNADSYNISNDIKEMYTTSTIPTVADIDWSYENEIGG